MNIPRLQDALKNDRLDVALFLSRDEDPNVRYLTGYGGAGWLVVPSKDDPFFVVSRMEEQKALSSGIEAFSGKGLMNDALRAALKGRDLGTARAGVMMDRLDAGTARELESWGVKLRDSSSIMQELRCVKSPKEIQVLKEACRLSDRILQKALRQWCSFNTESDVAAFLEFHAKKEGCCASFPTIIASGAHAGVPHHETSASLLKKGFCIVDWGVRYKGYCADLSRTVCIGGVSGRMEGIYQRVLHAQQEGIDAARDGVSCRDVDAAARNSLGDLEKQFIHGLGHGIGVEVHERPWVNSRSKDVLKRGMCIAIEPGVYASSFGIRIEDDLLVTGDGARLLTKTARELVVV